MVERNKRNYEQLVQILDALGMVVVPAKTLNTLWSLRMSWQARGCLNEREVYLLKTCKDQSPSVYELLEVERLAETARKALETAKVVDTKADDKKVSQKTTSKQPEVSKGNTKNNKGN